MRRNPTRLPFYSKAHRSWAIPLTQGVIALVDKDIAASLGNEKWQAVRINKHWYAAGGSPIHYMHRAIIKPKPALQVDHRQHHPIKDNIVDNRRSNLRECSVTQNRRNKAKTRGRSPFKGLTWHPLSGMWQVRIKRDYQTINLGYFRDPEEGARAYDAAAVEFHGDFAATNAGLGLLD